MFGSESQVAVTLGKSYNTNGLLSYIYGYDLKAYVVAAYRHLHKPIINKRHLKSNAPSYALSQFASTSGSSVATALTGLVTTPDLSNSSDIANYHKAVELNNSVVHETGMMISIQVLLEPQLFLETKSYALLVYNAIIKLLNDEGVELRRSREGVRYDKSTGGVDDGVEDDENIVPRRSSRKRNVV